MIAAALAALVFQGGDIGSFVQTLGGWAHRPVVALVQAERARPFQSGPTAEQIAEIKKEFPTMRFDDSGPEFYPSSTIKRFETGLTEVGDGKLLVPRLKLKAGLESSIKEGGVALWDPVWQPGTTDIEMSRIPLPDGWSEADKALALTKGRLTTNLKSRQAVTVKALTILPWSKPVKVHWLLNQMWVVPYAKDAGERETLATMARAISGKLVETKDAWRIDLDPQAFRLRAQASIDRREVQEAEKGRLLDRQGKVTPLDIEVSRTGFALSRAAWKNIDDDTIVELFGVQNRNGYRPIKQGTPLYTALSRYVAAMKAWSENPPKGRENVGTMYRRMFDLVDWNGSPGLFLGQNLGTAAGCPRIGGGTVMIN